MKTRLPALFIIIFSLLFFNEIKGQLSSVNIAGEQFSGRIAFFKDEDITAIKGSTYISDDWMIGSMETRSGTRTEGLFRLNALTKEIEMITGQDTLIIDKSFDIERVMLGGLEFVSTLTIEERANKFFINSHFLNLVEDGNVQLLKRFNVGAFHNSYVPHYMAGAGDGNTYYRMGTSFYYRRNDGSAAYRLSRKTGSIANLFYLPKNEIKKVMRENRINIHNDKDLARLFKILNKKYDPAITK